MPRKWIAKGKSYKNLEQGKGDTESNIEVEEVDSGINMPYGSKVFGEPIDAQLAVYYIRRFWNQIKNDEILSTQKKVNAALQMLEEKFLKVNSGSEKKAFDDLSNEIKGQTEKAEKWILNLLDNAFAVTIEKRMLLKILSQPQCEGLRFYLCMKDTENSPFGSDTPGKVTVLTVGVDNVGTDLHFIYDEKIHGKGNFAIPDIENVSLCEEYPRTPGRIYSKMINAPELIPYVLFKYALVPDKNGETHIIG